ncbi:MAG: response regulator [bacterium]|nr:response regulator [bacterium]
MKNIILSMGWSISSIFILAAILYLFLNKRKNNNYNNNTYNWMIFSVVVVIIFEILSVFTISIKDKIPVLNEIVCRTYLYSIILCSFTSVEHMSQYGMNSIIKIIRVIEIAFSVVGLVACIFIPIDYTTSVPYAVCGQLTICILFYAILGSLTAILLMSLKIVKLKGTSLTPYIITFALLTILTVYQILTKDFMNTFSMFFTFIVAYLFYNTESQDSALLENYEKIKAESDAKNKERDEFIANLSREIRTPMSNIVGFSNLIILDQDNMKLDAVNKDGIEIHKEAINLLSIINNILDLSRFEAGKEKKEEREYLFEKLILDINNDLINTYNDVKISYKFMKDFPNDLYGDNLKIEKVVQLICEYVTKDRVGRSLLLEFAYKIIDNQTIEELITFNLANVGVEGTLRQNKLDLEKQIIDAYNGVLDSKIKYIQDTDNNVVCSLSITQKVLSERKLENINEKIKAASIKNENKEISDYSDKTILIVDDSQMNINIAKRLFIKYGFTIEEAISGNDCIKKVQEKKYDIIFLDDMMPGLSGVQTLGELKNMGLNLPPVIALTANSYDGLKDEYVKNGFTDYLAKPIEPNKLDKMINNLFDDKGGEK